MAGLGKKLQMLLWYANFLRRKKYKQPYINQYAGRCCVLANGPSLKDALAKYDAGELEITNDSVMVNLAALDEHFWKIKPKHMCFSDILFFQNFGPRKDAVKKQFAMLNDHVDWEINLYLCYKNPQEIKSFIEFSHITNTNIHFIPMNEIYVEKWPVKYWKRMLDSGYFMPHKGTVANVALHVALLCGYEKIELYGMDHNWFLDFFMADDNHLNFIDKHFYDKPDERKMKPAFTTYGNGGNTRIGEYMETFCFQFRSHEIHSWWAKQLGVDILNCCPESMIDSFARIGRDGNIHPCPYDINETINRWEAYY